MIIRFLFVLLSSFVLVPVGFAFAQSDSATEDSSGESANGSDDVEALYDKSTTEETKPVTKAPVKPKEPPAKSLSDLNTLSEFSDVAIIQKRFLPKTGRFEASLSGITNVNNPFFTNIGLSGGFSYYFREKYGLELLFSWIGTGSRQVTKDLQKSRSINTDNLVTSKGFLGAAFKWNPIYGKMTWLNQYIVPFDLNFSLGLGMTKTNEDENEPTLHLATSQVFALSKAMAVRWDINWNMFNATTTSSSGAQDKLFQNDIYLGLGASFYFPEATYR